METFVFWKTQDEKEPRPNPLVRYYPHIMPVLKDILIKCDQKEERLFRARALECATLFGDTIPKEQYINNAQQLMQVR